MGKSFSHNNYFRFAFALAVVVSLFLYSSPKVNGQSDQEKQAQEDARLGAENEERSDLNQASYFYNKAGGLVKVRFFMKKDIINIQSFY